MIFWVLAALMTVLVLFIVTRPLFKAGNDLRNAAAYDVEVYKSQIGEVDRELEEGVINTAEADAAKAEIARRLLAADSRASGTDGEISNKAGKTGIFVGLAVSATVAVGTLLIYLQLGLPGAPDLPYAAREAEREQARAATERDTGNLEQMADRLAQRLADDPGNLDNTLLLARTYMTIGSFDRASATFRRAAELDPNDADIQSALGEALVFWADGIVTDEAMITFERVLTMGGESVPRAAFYLAEGNYQQGFRQEALDGWVQLANQGSPTDPWFPAVRERIVTVADELGVDPDELVAPLPEAPQVATAPSGSSAPGPTAEDIEAAQELSEVERQAMIRGMVDNLALKMQDNPMDFQGWMRLIRARAVLGEKDQAEADLSTALSAFSRAPIPRAQLVSLAQEMELDLPEGFAAPEQTQQQAAPGPSPEQMAAAQEMSDEDREAMIAGMVEGLAARLEDDPNDLEGWMRLARSYNVLGRPADAYNALVTAGQTFPNDTRILLLQGRILRSSQATEDAEAALAVNNRVLELDPDNIEALWFAALNDMATGNRDGAATKFDRAIAGLPEGSEDRKALETQRDRLLSMQP